MQAFSSVNECKPWLCQEQQHWTHFRRQTKLVWLQHLQQQSLHSVGCSAVQLLHRGTPLLSCCACTSISSREKHSRWAVFELPLQHIPLVGGVCCSLGACLVGLSCCSTTHV